MCGLWREIEKSLSELLKSWQSFNQGREPLQSSRFKEIGVIGQFCEDIVFRYRISSQNSGETLRHAAHYLFGEGRNKVDG